MKRILLLPLFDLLALILALLLAMAAASAQSSSSESVCKLSFNHNAPDHALAKDSVATRVPLFAPDLEELARMVEIALKPHFEIVEVSVDSVPDLRSWGLAASGLGGRNRLVDLGGTHHQVTERADTLRWDLATVAEAIGLGGVELEAKPGGEAEQKVGGAVFIGAGGVSRTFMGGCNGEMMPAEQLPGDTGLREGGADTEMGKRQAKWGERGLRGGLRKTRVARVVDYQDDDDQGRVEVMPYDSPVLGFLANMMASDGNPGKAVHVRVRRRHAGGPKVSSFTNLIRESLREQLREQQEKGEAFGNMAEGSVKAEIEAQAKAAIGIGGVFRVTSGVVRAHVMRDTGGKRFHSDAEVGVSVCRKEGLAFQNSLTQKRQETLDSERTHFIEPKLCCSPSFQCMTWLQRRRPRSPR